MFTNAVVNTLIVAAEYYEVSLHREFISHMLIKLLAVGRSKDNLIIFSFSLQSRNAAVDGFALHHHSSKAAIRIVVNTTPLVEGIVTQVVQMNLCQPLLLRPCQYRLVDKSFQHFGQNCYNINSHNRCKYSEFSPIIQPFACKMPISCYVWEKES